MSHDSTPLPHDTPSAPLPRPMLVPPHLPQLTLTAPTAMGIHLTAPTAMGIHLTAPTAMGIHLTAPTAPALPQASSSYWPEPSSSPPSSGGPAPGVPFGSAPPVDPPVRLLLYGMRPLTARDRGKLDTVRAALEGYSSLGQLGAFS